MAALELAVRNAIPGALLLEKLITADSKHLKDKVKYMFSGVKEGGLTYTKCEHCNNLFGHECLQEREVHVGELNLAGSQIGSNVVCLVCFDTCFDLPHLMGHLLMHSSAGLARVSLSDKLILRHLQQKYPRGPKVANRRKGYEDASDDDEPILPLLEKNQAQNDGFTLVLL